MNLARTGYGRANRRGACGFPDACTCQQVRIVRAASDRGAGRTVAMFEPATTLVEAACGCVGERVVARAYRDRLIRYWLDFEADTSRSNAGGIPDVAIDGIRYRTRASNVLDQSRVDPGRPIGCTGVCCPPRRRHGSGANRRTDELVYFPLRAQVRSATLWTDPLQACHVRSCVVGRGRPQGCSRRAGSAGAGTGRSGSPVKAPGGARARGAGRPRRRRPAAVRRARTSDGTKEPDGRPGDGHQVDHDRPRSGRRAGSGRWRCPPGRGR